MPARRSSPIRRARRACRRANRQLDADGIPEKRRFRQVAECRYVGQGFELRADAQRAGSARNPPDGHREFLQCAQAGLRPRLPRPVLRDHHAARHRHLAVDTLKLPKLAKGGAQSRGGRALRRRTVFDDGRALDTPRYQREKLLRRRHDRRAGADRPAQFDDARAASAMSRPCWTTATCASNGKSGERHGKGSRSHQPAGHRRRAALHRRADGQRALPHELFVDHPREPGSRRRPVRPRLQHALRERLDADAYRLAAGLSARHRKDRCRSTPGNRATASSTTIPITAPAIRRTSASSCRSSSGELVGFSSANTAHHVDIGAATPGLVIDIPDVFAEGMLLNGLKLYNEGVRNERCGSSSATIHACPGW